MSFGTHDDVSKDAEDAEDAEDAAGSSEEEAPSMDVAEASSDEALSDEASSDEADASPRPHLAFVCNSNTANDIYLAESDDGEVSIEKEVLLVYTKGFGRLKDRNER